MFNEIPPNLMRLELPSLDQAALIHAGIDPMVVGDCEGAERGVTVKFFETPRSVFLLPCSARKLLAVDCLERSAVAYSCRSLRCIR